MIVSFLAVAAANRLFDHEVYKTNITGNLDLAMYVACVEKRQTSRGIFNPNLTIVESTVRPGTTSLVWRLTGGKHHLVHSPVRGNKRDGFKWAYFTYTKFIGACTPEAGNLTKECYEGLGFKTRLCSRAVDTEVAKILNTARYGLDIAWTQEEERICQKLGASFSAAQEFKRTTEIDSGGKVPRPVYYPGKIGGHCVIPNAKILKEVYPSKFMEALLESNELEH